MAGSRCCRFRFSGATPAQQNHGAAERRRRVMRAYNGTRRDATPLSQLVAAETKRETRPVGAAPRPKLPHASRASGRIRFRAIRTPPEVSTADAESTGHWVRPKRKRTQTSSWRLNGFCAHFWVRPRRMRKKKKINNFAHTSGFGPFVCAGA